MSDTATITNGELAAVLHYMSQTAQSPDHLYLKAAAERLKAIGDAQ